MLNYIYFQNFWINNNNNNIVKGKLYYVNSIDMFIQYQYHIVVITQIKSYIRYFLGNFLLKFASSVICIPKDIVYSIFYCFIIITYKKLNNDSIDPYVIFSFLYY